MDTRFPIGYLEIPENIRTAEIKSLPTGEYATMEKN